MIDRNQHTHTHTLGGAMLSSTQVGLRQHHRSRVGLLLYLGLPEELPRQEGLQPCAGVCVCVRETPPIPFIVQILSDLALLQSVLSFLVSL